jgi:enamine deaminase RidA (YjgF/YER057c/UK114 family)
MTVDLIRRPPGLGEPLGRYSHISVAHGTAIVTVAGQCGIDESGALTGDKSVTAQARQAFTNVVTALQHVDLSPSDLIKTTTFLVGAENIEEFMQARADVFAELFPSAEYPPNTLLVVSRLVEARFAVEIEATAIRSDSSS